MKPHRTAAPFCTLLAAAAATAVTAAAATAVTAATLLAASPASAGSVTYQAEDAALSGGAVVAADHDGYTGTGFVAGAQLGALWIYADTADVTTPVLVKDLTITESTYQAILLSYQKTITNLTFDHVAVTGAGTFGIELNAAGSAYVTYVTVTGAASGGLNNITGYTLDRGPGDSGF